MKALFFAIFFVASLGLRAQQLRVVRTDSSRIETREFTFGKSVREIITAQDRVYSRFYAHHNRTATSTATYTKAGALIGLVNHYDEQGNLLYAIDHDHGIWRAVQLASYPFYDLQVAMQRKADAYLAAMYGPAFLAKNAAWNIDASYVSNDGAAGPWTRPLAGKPVRFLFSYDVKLDTHVYPELIRFELDDQGNFIPEEGEEVWGFEQRYPVPTNGFELVYRKAMETAKKKSGARNKRLIGLIHWERMKQPNPYNGQFRFYVAVKTGAYRELHPNGRSRVTDYYDVYSFSPWTGDFLEKKKMETFREWEKNSGSSYGLRPSR